MSTYSPDRWVMLQLTNTDGATHYRIFGSWSGGYLDGDSWKLNSGVETVSITDNIYSFEGTSGSVYKCHKRGYGTTGYGAGVLSGLIEDSKKLVTITVLSEDTDFLNKDYNERTN